jgi:hypothetical protein
MTPVELEATRDRDCSVDLLSAPRDRRALLDHVESQADELRSAYAAWKRELLGRLVAGHVSAWQHARRLEERERWAAELDTALAEAYYGSAGP